MPRNKALMLPAPLWKRVVAYLIDSAILLFILSPLNVANNKTSLNITLSKGLLLLIVVSMVLVLAYWSVLEYLFNQSVGKMFMNISVVSLAKGKLRFKQALIRNLSKVSSLLLAIDCLNLFLRKSNQRYLETFVKTEVQEVLE